MYNAPLSSNRFISFGIFIVAAFALLGLSRFCLLKTRGFALYKIRSSLSFDPQWEVPTSHSEEEAKAIFHQPYHFLDKGAQAYVFLSQDGKYVIKFLKLHALQPPMWLNFLHLPLHLQPYRLQKMWEKKQALHKTFSSYKIAYEELKEETGLVFMHLNKTKHLHQKLTIYDAIGIAHELDLDEMEFFVQKRASLFYAFLIETIEKKGMESAKNILTELIDFLVRRNCKQIFDKDPDLATNFGFLEKLIQIDIGRFRKDPQCKNPEFYRDEIIRITDTFNLWLKKHYPPLALHLEKEIAKI